MAINTTGIHTRDFKSYFVKNAIPTESQFADLINGLISQRDDGTAKRKGGTLSIEAPGDEKGPKKLINFYESFTDANPAWVLSLKTKDSKENIKLGLTISDGDGNICLFIERNGGNIGIGTVKPTAKLEVDGRIKDQSGFVIPVGSIVAFAGSTAPAGWLLCNGLAIPSDAAYSELRALIGNTTPNLDGRTLIGAGDGYTLGQTGGEKQTTLTIAQMPAHHHTIGGGDFIVHSRSFTGSNDADRPWKTKPGATTGGTDDAGGGAPFSLMQPYYVVNYIIKY